MPRRGENIHKRKDGRWEGRYIRGYDNNNKAQYSSVYAHSYKDVREKLSQAKINVQKKNNTDDDSKRKNIDSISSQWLSKIRLQIKHSTYVKYSNIVKNHIIPNIGLHKISELTTEEVRRFSEELLLSGNVLNHKGLSNKSVKDIISVLHLIIKYAAELGIESNCNFDLINIKSKNSSVESISESAHQALVEYLLKETDYIKLGILICLYTGLRIGEICALRFEDVSLTDNLICVKRTMQRLQTLDNESEAKTAIMISTPKSECSCRQIPLPDFIASIIGSISYKPKDYILTGEADRFIEPRTMENKFKRCLKECGLGNYNFHQLRHRFATYCIEVGFEVKCLSEILGHSNVNITLNRYVHSSLELKRLNMNKLEDKFVH